MSANKKRQTSTLSRAVLPAAFAVFMLAAASVVYITIQCQRFLKTLITDSDSQHFFNFGS